MRTRVEERLRCPLSRNRVASLLPGWMPLHPPSRRGSHACVVGLHECVGYIIARCVSVSSSSRDEESIQPSVSLLTGGGEVVWRRGGKPIEAQPGGEFEIGVAELAGRESAMEIRASVWAARLVLGQPIGPPRLSLLYLLDRHPDDNLMRKGLSPHGHTLSGTKKRPYVPFDREREWSISAAMVLRSGKWGRRACH